MDFELDDDLEAARGLAGQILGDRSTPDRLKETAADDGFDRATWIELVNAGLVGLVVPEALGGSGLGLLGPGLVAEAVGHHTAAVPFRQVVPALMAYADAGDASVVTAIAADGQLAVLGLDISHDDSRRTRPEITVSGPDGEARLHGEVPVVGFGAVADRFVLGARTEEGAAGLYDVAAGDCEVTALETTTDLPHARVVVDGAAARRLGDENVLAATADRSLVLACLTMAGVCEGALGLAGSYTSEREQFGSKIGTFQAVAHRLADAYIDQQAIRLTALQACWRMDREVAHHRELAGARFWAAEGGQRIVHATQHVHGGIGVDTDYPLFRYFRWAKELELDVGGATRALVDLGRSLAAEPVGN